MRTPSEHWERVEAALAGAPLDAPPVSLWRHFPEVDQQAESLAAATVAWQRRFAFDFVKAMPPGDYPVIAWGGASEYRGSPNGTRTVTRCPVQRAEDWATIRPLRVDRGAFRVVIGSVRLVVQELEGTVPVLQTIFSPLTVAFKLSAGRVVQDIATHPDRVREALAAITKTTRELIRASLVAGAHGIFFATQCATADVMDAETYAQWGCPWDLDALAEASGASIVLLHLHGPQPHFDLVLDYPVNVLNWHDRRAGPSLREGEQRSGRCVAGGIDETRLAEREPEAAADEAVDAVRQLGGRHLMVTPGCVIPIATPEATIEAIVRAVRRAGAPARQN
ncbi:uroporphyrinogen decarboxylase [Thermomicrobium sp. 4228-Ro]|uniref:uroporphyrinogen decarboxylase family protein n=1 Tax=Thermomicrobium sp. 4228-Ro TaxID=2993937 RepID=UPI00224992C7|nr:uroporphyrinogen decarboxylase family protein [Thermomicrobium sp. 4228-Ro]MCX2727048.1 uroporphyrinogen decarboxylase [Thermomicrobium sp. 4228-Ro]